MEPALLQKYKVFCRYREEGLRSGCIDLSQCRWVSPAMLLPLAQLRMKTPVTILPPKDQNVAAYITIATTSGRKGKTYIPLVHIPRRPEELPTFMQQLYAFYDEGKELGGQDAFKYFFGELITNIYEHSKSAHAMVMAQKYSTTVELCICDDGISIPGSFVEKGMRFSDDYEALALALNGLSSKESVERGWGLNSNVRMWTSEAKAEILVVSGCGAVYFHGTSEPKTYKLDSPFALQGTLISMRYTFPVKVNIYPYIG